MKKPAFLLIAFLALTAPASAAFLGGNSRLGESFLDAGSRHVAGELSRERLPDSGGTWLRMAAECFVAPSNVVDKSWKLKIEGTAQKTGTPGHQFRTYREAIAEAKNPDVRSVHLDHGYNRGLDLDPKTIQPNRRPDVLSVYNDNSVLRIEVQSRTDIPAVLRSRNAALDAQLRAQGFTPTPPRVVRPTTTP